MKYFVGVVCLLCVGWVQAQTQASVPYTPSWQVRHHLQWLADHADLPLTLSQWPLPKAAIERALADMPYKADHHTEHVAWIREQVLRDLQLYGQRGQFRGQLRTPAESLSGFDDNYTPGSSLQIQSSEWQWGQASDAATVAVRLGMRLEASSHSLQNDFKGHGSRGHVQFRPEGSAMALGFGGWQLQAFSHQHWWGPGWQSSLVNGHNNPSWTGLGVQRLSVSPSRSAWLSWMGPWNLDVFVARAQDPLVVSQQPSGFLFSGMRLTLKPQTWLELGVSRGLQTGGAGRPGGVVNFMKAFAGQELNKNPEDSFEDSSSQIAGYDARLRCPKSWGALLGSCAAYTQWMGEDAAGQLPLPFKFMSLWGWESTYGDGQYRVFAEWTNTNAYSLPWDSQPTFPGYLNSVYRQGYTQGGRWVGSAQGAGSRVITLGWMDASAQRLFKVHKGRIHVSLGSYDPGVNAPRGDLWGFSASQAMTWGGMRLTPELAYLHLSEGDDQRANHRKSLRFGLSIDMPL